MNRDPNKAFRNKKSSEAWRRYKIKSSNAKPSHIVSTKDVKTIHIGCPVCGNHTSVNVEAVNSIDINAIRCEDCRLEEMGK